MKDNGGSLCQVEQLPYPCVPLPDPGSAGCRIQANRHLHNHHLNHQLQSWVSRPAPDLTSTPTPASRHRANGAVGAWCSSPECPASRLDEVTDQALRGAGMGTGRVLVTGGAGYFGLRLGRALASQGVSVVLLDLHKPQWDTPDGTVFHQSDIRDYDSLYKICEGVDCIFHTNFTLLLSLFIYCWSPITLLVYTSTINVTFAGKPIEEGDEDSLPCVPLDMHIDHYSRTKSISDQMVLTANGRSLKGGGLLRTCVLRPSGIYGPEERRHLHRVMVSVNVERRLFSFSFGNRQAKMNWVHVDNLVLAHVLAAESLTPKRNCVASGQAYFINDGESVNLFEWLTPLFEKLGYSRPLIHLPVSLVYSAAILMECLHLALRPIVEIPLLFTRNEVSIQLCIYSTYLLFTYLSICTCLPAYPLLTSHFNSALLPILLLYSFLPSQFYIAAKH
uniref:Short chain dehydrogenase/reductase family 42E, member 2 n=1 Tax=Hucho hucho TaxID=62062 RepID=A0A4W5QNB1_9TELE